MSVLFYCISAQETKWTYAPTAKTQNVKVILLNADRLLDGETYYLKAVINQVDAGGTFIATLNVIDVEVTKMMPTELPTAFKIRRTQENEAAKHQFYVRPWVSSNSWDITSWFDASAGAENSYGAIAAATSSSSYNPWGQGVLPFFPGYEKKARTTRATAIENLYEYRWATDVRPFNFEEIFDGLCWTEGDYLVWDENYIFVFPGCGDVTENEYDADAITSFKMYDGYNGVAGYFNYTGVKADKSSTENKVPGYYLPFVRYTVINEYNAADKLLAVKAGYRYKNISFTLDEDGDVNLDNDYIVKPQYFNEKGRFVKNASDAKFNVYFNCALDKNFTAASHVKVTKFYTKENGSNYYSVWNGTNPYGKDNKAMGTATDNTIPYGFGFDVELDSIGATWTSDLAALTVWNNNEKAFGASYFKTNFGQFTQDYTKGDALKNEGKSYYTDTVAVVNDYLYSNNNNLYDVKNKKTTWNSVNWIKVVDITDPIIEKVEMDEIPSGKVTLTKDEINGYFTITYYKDLEYGKYGVQVRPNMTALNPEKLGQIRFTFKSTAKLVHQWGHTVDLKNGNGTVIYYGKPYSTPNLSRSNR